MAPIILAALVCAAPASAQEGLPFFPQNDTYPPFFGTLEVDAHEGVLANDFAFGDLVATVDEPPAHGTLALEPDGAFTYTADPGFVGEDRFVYRAHLRRMGLPASVFLTVEAPAPSGRSPHANDDAFTLGQDTVLTVPAPGVLDNDTDPDGDPLTVWLIRPPREGVLRLEDDGGFLYVPDPGYAGPDSFAYRVSDGVETDDGAVELTIAPAALPVGLPHEYDLGQVDGAPYPVEAVHGVLAGATDPEGDELHAELDAGPALGALVLHPDGGFVYTPDLDAWWAAGATQDSFVWRPSDGGAPGEPVVVTLYGFTNEAPVAADDSYALNLAVARDMVVEVATGVLANDRDRDGDALIATLAVPPADGTVDLSEDGSFLYTPNPGFVGTDGFGYLAGDGHDEDGAVVVVSIFDTGEPDAGEGACDFDSGPVFEGDFAPTTTADLIGFCNDGWRILDGDLLISHGTMASLDGMECLHGVTGSVRMAWNHRVGDIDGLRNLDCVGEHLIVQWDSGLLYPDLPALRFVGGDFDIWNVSSIGGPGGGPLRGFDSLQHIDGSFRVARTSSINDISGFGALTHISGSLSVTGNSAMRALTGFEALVEVGGDLSVTRNTGGGDLTGDAEALAERVAVGGATTIAHNR
jgi:hypothetical protein